MQYRYVRICVQSHVSEESAIDEIESVGNEDVVMESQ